MTVMEGQAGRQAGRQDGRYSLMGHWPGLLVRQELTVEIESREKSDSGAELCAVTGRIHGCGRMCEV